MSDTIPRRGGRRSWLILALVALIAILALAYWVQRTGTADGVVVENATAEEAGGRELAGRAEDRTAAGAEAPVGEVGEDLAEGARDAAGAVETMTDRAADLTAERAKTAAQAAETVVERSTDGNPDSDGDEAR